MSQWKTEDWVQMSIEDIITDNIARRQMGGRDTRAHNALEMDAGGK